MSVFGWIIIHQHLDSTFDWKLPWADYRNGFGSLNFNSDTYWLGLEIVHLLTSSQPYRLRVEVQKASSELWYSAEYWSVQVGDETNDKYQLDVSGYSGDAGNQFVIELGMMFTTVDSDNDLADNGYNCAVNKGGGWWYNSCYISMLTGPGTHHEWSGDLISSRMMIKPQ